MPIKSAVFEIFPWCFLSCVVKYSFSKYSRASFNGDKKDCFKIFFSNANFDEGFKTSSIILFIFSLLSFADKIVIRSTKFLNSRTLPG